MHVTPLDSITHICQSSFMSLFQKSSKLAFSFIEKWPRLVRCLTSLNEKWSKVCWTCWRKRKERSKGHLALWEAEVNRESFFWPFVWVPERARHRERESFSLRGAIQTKRERNTVRVWESEKEKWDFFFPQITHKKYKLIEFSWSFWVIQL